MTDHTPAQAALDVAIIGGGAAGLSAALLLARARRQVVVIDGGAPRNRAAVHSHGFPTRDGITPGEWVNAARAEVTAYGARLLADTVRDVAPDLTVTTGNGQTLRTRRLLVTTGARDVLPEVGGLAEYWGSAVHNCPYCHGWELRDQPLAVFGRRVGAVRKALLLSQWSSQVVLVVGNAPDPADALRLEAAGVQVRHGTVSSLLTTPDNTLHGLELTDGTTVGCSGAFVAPHVLPEDELLRKLGCSTTEDGSIVADREGRTSVPGVYAAGNVVDPSAQMVSAAGDGTRAATAINGDLTEDSLVAATADFSAAMERLAARSASATARNVL